MFIFGHMGHDATTPQCLHKLPFLILLVCTQAASLPATVPVQQDQGGFPLGPRAGLGHTSRRNQTVIVLRQHVSQITRLSCSRITLAIQARFWVRAALVGIAQQSFPPAPAASPRRIALLPETAPIRP